MGIEQRGESELTAKNILEVLKMWSLCGGGWDGGGGVLDSGRYHSLKKKLENQYFTTNLV